MMKFENVLSILVSIIINAEHQLTDAHMSHMKSLLVLIFQMNYFNMIFFLYMSLKGDTKTTTPFFVLEYTYLMFNCG